MNKTILQIEDKDFDSSDPLMLIFGFRPNHKFLFSAEAQLRLFFYNEWLREESIRKVASKFDMGKTKVAEIINQGRELYQKLQGLMESCTNIITGNKIPKQISNDYWRGLEMFNPKLKGKLPINE